MTQLVLSRGSIEVPLTDPNGWTVLTGVQGMDNPPIQLISQEPATWDGSLHLAGRYQAREVFLPLFCEADDQIALRKKLRELAVLLDVKQGPVTLEVAHHDGTRRWISGYLTAPFGQALAANEGKTWRLLGVTLRCDDPFWMGDVRSTFYSFSDVIPQFLPDHFLPINLADSQLAGWFVIVNSADTDAFARWTITGPLSNAVITVNGGTWEITDPGLDAGETMVVDMGRGVQSVLVNGIGAWGRLGPGAQFNPISPGSNTVTLTFNGATSETMMVVEWRERWLTAW